MSDYTDRLEYFPRTTFLESVLAVYDSGISHAITLFAPRRHGKTWFAKRELIPAADNRRWQTVYVDLWRDRDQPELALVEGLEAAVRGRGLRKRLAIKEVDVGIDVQVLQAGIKAVPTDTAPGTLVRRLRRAVDAIGEKRCTTLIVFDEFQELALDRNADFIAALRAAIQSHEDSLRVFYTGSSRERLDALFRRQRAPLFGSAHALTLPILGKDFVANRAALINTKAGKKVKLAALAGAFERLHHVPAHLNSIAVDLILTQDGDVEAAFDRWLARERDDEAGQAFMALPLFDRLVLIAVASRWTSLFGEHSRNCFHAIVRHADPVAEADVPSAGRVQSALDRLRSSGLVATTGERGLYEIEDTRMLVYLTESRLLLAQDNAHPPPGPRRKASTPISTPKRSRR